uniref:NADH-ubiquinone oxidoreductase chain 4 n=2 Tax=Haemaphysalis flava TaxID=181088 RepID=Q76LQ3_HAEFA|nr:NADH dehydrogenase subunit 4 [Haemaphysalis flava]QAX90627.1 NADH dehydrogenase subunit 4 [Haemaphysalis flava]UNO53828.1 NADH dehydrogenase subunit 4 [Haemaphysalis flava]UXX50246.1 NADH dehydrogenase subunit 4 [Haemaphysalis flava]BAD03992.1 NADH dehydrogenase 4 [Haemaphysalis flava]
MLKLILMSLSILCMFSLLEGIQMMISIIFVFFLTVLMYFSNFYMISPFFGIDLMSLMLILLTIWISFLMMLASFTKKVSNNKSFIFYLTMMMMLLIICFSVLNLIFFYFFFESVLFPIVMMIFGWGSQPERLQAGIYMLMYTLFGSLPLLVMMLIFKKTSLMYLFIEWQEINIGIYFFLMMLGFLVKIPVFFFHLWLPKAHVEAPISGSMILAGVLLKLGIYGIFRFKSFYFIEILNFSYLLMILSIWGSVMVSIYCLFQTDIKSLIAYSSVCHMGIVFSGTINFSFFGSYGSLLLMIGHGLCSSGLFCLANLVYERFYTRSMILIKGLMKIFPSLTLMWFLFSIVNMSAPMTMNLMGELFLCLSIMKYSMFFIGPIMILIFMSACYSMYMYSYLNHGEGWVLWSCKMINLREYYLLILHLIPMILWMFKFNFFFKWI